MALRSEQARVLKRRVLGVLIRNLVLFSGAFALVCFSLETFVVPSVANYVADVTSSWRTLDASPEFRRILVDQGMLDNGLFDMGVEDMVNEGYSGEAGTVDEIQGQVNEMQDAISEYATGLESNAVAEAADEKARAETKTSGAASGTPEVDADEEVTGIDAADTPATDDGARNASADDLAPVPLVSYEQILEAQNVVPAEASAAQALAALHASASIQELRLSLTLPSPFVPENTSETEVVQILTSAAAMGYDQQILDEVLGNAYRQAQDEVFNTWTSLPADQRAQAVGLSDEHPVWQTVTNENGVTSVRDVATYTFIKSFKLPLAALVFVAGWLFIILRTLNKSLRYFDDLAEAVGKLLADKDAPIELPPDLSIAHNELAVIRSQSLADERAAHAAEQRKNELVAYLAHDIRTPLTSVLGYLDLLRETTDLPRDTLRKYAGIAYAKAERLESLINEFFEITRYNLSAIPIERETIGVRLFCQQVAEAFFPEASARGIRISIDVGAADRFFVDPDKLARALGNVLRNAVAYADPNSTIALAARPEGRFTTITVANRGREISDAHLETIFEKFYREDGARTTRSGGAGLGLAIAREIVVAHHGAIEAASERGVTVFTLRIPTEGDDGADSPAALAPTTPAREGHLRRQRADDDLRPPRAATAPGRPRPEIGPPSRRSRAAHPGEARPLADPGERSATAPQSSPRLKPCNGRHGAIPATGALRDNSPTPRRRGRTR